MKFSLIITTYNSENYVEQAIISVLNQTRLPDEIIICDDNSTDNTIKLCEKFNDKLKIHINNNGPSGYTNAFNYAFKLGTGDYITILHFDDLIHPLFIETAEKLFQKHSSCKFLACKNSYFKTNNDVFKSNSLIESIENSEVFTGKEYAHKYLEGVTINNNINRCPGSIFHKSLLDKINFRNEAGLLSDDDLFYRVGLYTDIIYIKQSLVSVRLNEESESGKLDELKINFEISKSYLFMLLNWNEKSLLEIKDFEILLYLFIKHNFRALYWSLVFNNKFKFNELKNHFNLIQKNIILKNYKVLVIKYKIFYFLIYFFNFKILSLFFSIFNKVK